MSKQTQGDFETGLNDQLKKNAFARQLEAAADIYLKKHFGKGHHFNLMIANQAVERFGTGDKAIRCVEYMLERARQSGTVSPTYVAFMVLTHIWDELKASMDAGTSFDFTQEPNADFRGHLRLAADNT